MKTIFASAGIILLAITVALPLWAESINPATKPQAAPMTAQEKKNLEMVMDWWREVLYAGHFDLAPKYQAENYIQHNPNADTGMAGFKAYFSALGGEQPIPDKLDGLVAIQADGDYVTLSFSREYMDPAIPNETYTTTWFDMFRIVNGKIVEHWDSATKGPGPTRVQSRG